MPIVIKKRVNFDFLGEDYKDSFLVFQSIPISDYGELLKSISEAGDDNVKATLFMLESLKKYFIEGTFPDLTVSKDDLEGLDGESILKCFAVFTGQEINADNGQEVPQVASLKEESKTPSSTEPAGPKN